MGDPGSTNIPSALAFSVGIDLPDEFQFGPTVLEPIVRTVKEDIDGATKTKQINLTDQDIATTSLDVLDHFRGTFTGFGFNTIFRPNSDKTPTPLPVKPNPQDPTDNVLQLSLTTESMVFSKALGNVPNRGLEQQADIMLNGVPYTQTIVDITEIVPGKQPVIHFEPGLWMRVPASEAMPNLAASFSRMASIPHGTSINAQCFEPAVTTKGAPNIPRVDITPFPVGGGNPVRFPNQTASSGNTHRLPQDLGSFIKDGTINQNILDDPNDILRSANKGKTIIESTTFTVLSSPEAPELGGGTSNIGFLIGADAGISTASVASRSANANAAKVTAQYWISKIRATIHLQASNRKDDPKPTCSPASLGPRDAVPRFIVDFDVPTPKTVTVEYHQIQYSQQVMLDFNGLRWPHVTVATIAPTAKHKLSGVLVQ